MVGRIPVMDVTPVVEGGRYPAKGTVGEPLPVTAHVFREGHDALNADVVLIDPKGRRRAPVRMHKVPEKVDLWTAEVVPDAMGPWSFEIESWSDPVATWRHNAEIKIPAGIDVELMFTEGALLLERASEALPRRGGAAQRKVLADAVKAVRDTKRPEPVRFAAATSPQVDEVLAAYPLRDLVTANGPFPVYVDRERALYGAWYEFFPRSEGAYVDDTTGKVVSGNFTTAAKRLDAVAAMGFDVLYLPPIHPIGEVNRKGRNNTLTPDPDDVGSPWAIGSKDGGHDAIHPDLGTFADFDAFVRRANDLGVEVALDLALQAAPDHPWVTTNPQWFTTRADGTIAYAENPPKKYQDIYPVNFDNDRDGIYREVLRVVKHWMKHGVRIFRVDNPHTKPVEFWGWLISEVRKTDPDVLFLSEAFTKPPMMRALATVGFHQSYTYFTWRTAKWEIEQYLTELAHQTSTVMRPNFFVNTPDILHAFLQYGGPAAFKIRAALAATGSPSWGVYAGYELFEHVAVKPGSEEYLDSEKYQIRIRDWDEADATGRTLAPYITRLNEIRRESRPLQLLRNVTIHSSEDDSILVFSKSAPGPDGTDEHVIVVINLDPHGTRETMLHLNMPALGLDWHDSFQAHDEITGETWTWWERSYVRLDPYHEPAHILTVRRSPA
ncbi:alpha-1,4-glucan--maltose-1-phosphate maltosyltransferase [Nocardioides iriomotensis]|uniref:Alpha-1,4-glucan:maltose-1-phosphate maltosyltransferase n=1 Tax=Nocardioides iriomotensis TaxID=715784 RepID=A0A4Q5IUF3_9ACTN|nr:alpha-1,4-glucan--maltose-1-phosphate maltosyltransferase [Nocardioides iriomotensis]RYU09343.1 alpha-1,4-glucan--maltose-1-phosphate maltosyltransferase [Nocardioides iriomotensis]